MTDSDATPRALRIEGDDRRVTLRKVDTRMGERLEIRAPAAGSIRLDAVALESVTWQDPGELARAAGREGLVGKDDPDADRSGATTSDGSETVTVANEYAQVEVARTTGDGADRLHLRSPKLGHEIALGPAELAWLTRQDHETFSAFLETPYGPEDDH